MSRRHFRILIAGVFGEIKEIGPEVLAVSFWGLEADIERGWSPALKGREKGFAQRLVKALYGGLRTAMVFNGKGVGSTGSPRALVKDAFCVEPCSHWQWTLWHGHMLRTSCWEGLGFAAFLIILRSCCSD